MNPPDWSALAEGIARSDIRALARSISLVENEVPGYQAMMQRLDIPTGAVVIGLTGPPGAGKSTLINTMLAHLVDQQDHSVAVVAVDPTSPFHNGSLLGDRVRMSDYYLHPNVFIRSLATRGALGGLSAKAVEVVDLLRAAQFDYILIETVGVGQSEVEIAGLADTTVVALVPEAGDDIQVIKSGLMEVADVFVVNKADRPNSRHFINYLEKMVHARRNDAWNIPVLPTIASQGEGIQEVLDACVAHAQNQGRQARRAHLMAEKAYALIQQRRMRHITKPALRAEIRPALEEGAFNLYAFVERYLERSSFRSVS